MPKRVRTIPSTTEDKVRIAIALQSCQAFVGGVGGDFVWDEVLKLEDRLPPVLREIAGKGPSVVPRQAGPRSGLADEVQHWLS